MTESSADRVPGVPEIDTSVACSARVYDFYLGGTTNFEVDREAAMLGAEAYGGLDVVRADIRRHRDYLGRAVRYLAGEVGLRQFLDIGTGIPQADNVHGVAQQTAPESRVVYVDNDPIVLAHAHELLHSTPKGAVDFLEADLVDPDNILERAAATLDLAQPIGLLLFGMLHHFPDDDDPYGIVAQLLAGVPSGSYLAISHLASDIQPEVTEAYSRSFSQEAAGFELIMRSHAEVSRFLDGLELVDPGVVPVNRWRPDDTRNQSDLDAPSYAAVGRKP